MAVTGFESQFSFYIQLEIIMKHKSLRGTIYEAGMSQYMGVELKNPYLRQSGNHSLYEAVLSVSDWINSQPGIEMYVTTYPSTDLYDAYIQVVVKVEDNDTVYSAEYASTDEDIKNVLGALGV
jgi:hypothetical protein